MKLTKGPWKYQKAKGHHHVLMGDESLDVNNKADARAIALVPEMIELLKELKEDKYADINLYFWSWANQLLKRVT